MVMFIGNPVIQGTIILINGKIYLEKKKKSYVSLLGIQDPKL